MVGYRRLRGRSRELNELAAALDAAADGRAVSVLLEGEAGIGKTALLDALGASAAEAGFTLWRAKAEELQRERPFGTLRAATGLAPDQMRSLKQFGAGPVAPARAGWVEVPELRFRVIDELVEAAEAVTAGSPLAFIVDDLQWIDELSLNAVNSLCRRVADRPLLVALASRPAGRVAELAVSLAGLDAGGHLALEPLSDESVAEIVSDVAGPEADGRTHAVAARGGGNPFFVLALLEAGAELDAPAEDGESTDGAVHIPGSLRRLVLEQFQQLPEEAQQVVQLASVLGSSFSTGSLSGVSARSMTSMFSALDAAIQAQFLVDVGGEIAFRHDLVREIVYDSMPPVLRSGLHLDMGRRLLALDVAKQDVTAHFMRGADLGDAEAASVLRQAARDMGRGAPATATQLLERALSLLPRDHQEYEACRGELIESYVFSAELDRSSSLAEEVLSSAPPPDVELSLRNARSQVFFLQGHARRAAEEFQSMVPLVAGQPREAVLLADAAVSAMFAIDLASASALATRSLELAASHGDTIAPALANGVLAWMAALRGELLEALELSERAVRAANAGPGIEGHRRIPHLFHSQVLLWADRVDEARSSLERGRAASSELAMGWDEPMYQALHADERIRAGELDDALAEADAGLVRAEEVGSHFADGWLHAHRARVHLIRGELDDAEHELASGEASLRGGGGQGLDQLWMLRGLLLVEQGDATSGLAVLETLWDKLDELETRLRQLELAPHLVRLAQSEQADELVVKVCDAVLHCGLTTGLPHAKSATLWCQALATGDPDRCLEAVAALERRRAPIEQARCQADAVELLARSGRAKEAGSLLAATRRFFDELGAPLPAAAASGEHAQARSRPRPRPLFGWESLTKSERRIALLVGDGMTNVEIAEALGISRRTVESHLYHAYPKLGLSSRVGLAVLAAQHRGAAQVSPEA